MQTIVTDQIITQIEIGGYLSADEKQWVIECINTVCPTFECPECEHSLVNQHGELESKCWNCNAADYL